MKVKPRKVKVSGFPRPRRLRFSAAYRPNSISRVFSRLRLSSNFSSLARIASRNRRESVSLKADDDVIRKTEDDHIAGRLALSPTLRPEIKDIVQVDVGEQRRCHRSLPCSHLTRRDHSVFENARLEPFLDQA